MCLKESCFSDCLMISFSSQQVRWYMKFAKVAKELLDNITLRSQKNRKLRKNSNMGGNKAQCPGSFPEKKNSTSRQKLYKSRYQSFLFFPVLLDFSTLFHQFCARLLGKGARLKTTALLVIFLFLKLVHNRHLDHLENCGIFSDFQHNFLYQLQTF